MSDYPYICDICGVVKYRDRDHVCAPKDLLNMPPVEKPRCATCRFWTRGEMVCDELKDKFGLCRGPRFYANVNAFPGTLTSDEFGCIFHEPRKAACDAVTTQKDEVAG